MRTYWLLDNTKPETIQTPEDTVENEPPQAPWTNSATLYSPMNGRSHASLLEFCVFKCPICDQSFNHYQFNQLPLTKSPRI